MGITTEKKSSFEKSEEDATTRMLSDRRSGNAANGCVIAKGYLLVNRNLISLQMNRFFIRTVL